MSFVCFVPRYNQVKNYDFVKSEFKGAAADFSQLVWKESDVVGFGSKEIPGKGLVVVAYYSPSGNNESLNFWEFVDRVTGAGDVEENRSK